MKTLSEHKFQSPSSRGGFFKLICYYNRVAEDAPFQSPSHRGDFFKLAQTDSKTKTMSFTFQSLSYMGGFFKSTCAARR